MHSHSGVGINQTGFRARIENQSLIGGKAFGHVLYSETGLSFWGGVDPLTGIVIDRHHSLYGQSIAGSILALPSGRGSCTGSCIMLELILNGVAPAALIFEQKEEILPLGVIVAQEMFGLSLPVLRISYEHFSALKNIQYLHIEDEFLKECDEKADVLDGFVLEVPILSNIKLVLNESDLALMNGEAGPAAQFAMKIIIRMAHIYDASSLIDVSQAHIDGCIYIGPGGLAFAEKLCEMGAQVAVPTTLNAISIDRRSWRQQGILSSLGEPAERLAEAYLKMGAKPSYTCAPYLLSEAPKRNDQIVWAESNAVVYANSVIGSRTIKYPDYLDICAALVGRTPLAGCHKDDERRPQMVFEIEHFTEVDDSFYPLLGYHIGMLSPNSIPFVNGIKHLLPTKDDMKSFGAAFATTSAAPMFHIAGITPEAELHNKILTHLPPKFITRDELCESWHSLNSSKKSQIDLIAIGNPHVSTAELKIIADLCMDYMGKRVVEMIITCGRDEYEKAKEAECIAPIEQFGAQFITDTCWCMLTEPVIPVKARVIMTNSGKYAHYAPALVGREMRFAALADCIKAACGLTITAGLPTWLSNR